MLRLNKDASEAMQRAGAHGCTDVTGFGLLGHAREMALASKVTLEIDWRSVEFLPGALDYSEQGSIPGGLKSNRAFVECAVSVEAAVPEPVLHLLYDPQTSGGLLIALPEESAPLVPGRRIGRVVARGAKPIVVN